MRLHEYAKSREVELEVLEGVIADDNKANGRTTSTHANSGVDEAFLDGLLGLTTKPPVGDDGGAEDTGEEDAPEGGAPPVGDAPSQEPEPEKEAPKPAAKPEPEKEAPKPAIPSFDGPTYGKPGEGMHLYELRWRQEDKRYRAWAIDEPDAIAMVKNVDKAIAAAKATAMFVVTRVPGT